MVLLFKGSRLSSGRSGLYLSINEEPQGERFAYLVVSASGYLEIPRVGICYLGFKVFGCFPGLLRNVELRTYRKPGKEGVSFGER